VSYRLKSGGGVRRRIRRVARSEIDKALEASRMLSDGGGEEIHDLRKAIKKTRALLRLLRGSMRPKERRGQDERLGKIARRLAPQRDALVRLQTLEKLESELPPSVQALDRRLRRQLDAERSSAAARRRIARDLRAGRRELKLLRRRAARWKIEQQGWQALHDGLVHDYRRVQQRLSVASADASDENLHGLRKAMKSHAYQIRLLAPWAPARLGARAEALDRITGELGDDRDLARLHSAVLAHPAASGTPQRSRMLQTIERRRERLDRAWFERAGRLFADPPSEFASRMHLEWQRSSR